MKHTKFLVVVDESPAAKRALRYVAKITARRRDFRVCLSHTLPTPPPELLEFGGSEDPEQESLLDARLKTEQKRWVVTAKKRLQPIPDQANSVLRKAGVAAGAIETGVCYPADGCAAAAEIIALARTRKCDTVVIGRDSLSWLGELIHGDPAEEIVRAAKGFTVWVVE